MPTFPFAELEAFVASLFAAAGGPADLAQAVAASLVRADLCGHESHGVMRAGRYIERIMDGTLRAEARPTVRQRRGANAVVDGHWGFGQIAAQFGTQLAIELCREYGQAGVSLYQTSHIGRLGDYAETLAGAGLVGLLMAGGGRPGGSVAPYGSRERLLGTNPLAMAVPTPPGVPCLVLDFATSAIPEGQVAVALANQRPVRAGSLIDEQGRPTTDAQAFYAGGALLPFGGHKGSALAFFIEILATTLASSAPAASSEYRPGNPTLLIAWSVENFVSRETYDRLVGELLQRTHASAPAEGHADVLLPGEIEARTAAERRRNGVPISAGGWAELSALGTKLGVAALIPAESFGRDPPE